MRSKCAGAVQRVHTILDIGKPHATFVLIAAPFAGHTGIVAAVILHDDLPECGEITQSHLGVGGVAMMHRIRQAEEADKKPSSYYMRVLKEAKRRSIEEFAVALGVTEEAAEARLAQAALN